MNFSIHIDDLTAMELQELVRQTGKTRNAVIKEAIRKVIEATHKKGWPSSVRELAGADKEINSFESYRGEFSPLPDDPLS